MLSVFAGKARAVKLCLAFGRCFPRHHPHVIPAYEPGSLAVRRPVKNPHLAAGHPALDQLIPAQGRDDRE
jgi:hypothetical protein